MYERPAALALALGILLRTSSPCSPSLPRDCVLPRTLAVSLLRRSHSHGLKNAGCHCHIFSCRATAIYTYPADLRRLARTPGLLHSSPTFQEPSPVDILASYPRLTPELTPSFTVTIALLGCCCRPRPHSVLLISAMSFTRTTGDNYQCSPTLSAPLFCVSFNNSCFLYPVLEYNNCQMQPSGTKLSNRKMLLYLMER